MIIVPKTDGRIDSGAQAIADNVNWVQIATIQFGEEVLFRSCILHGAVVGSGALTHFKFTWAEMFGGTHTDWQVDTDFNTADAYLIDATPNLSTTAGGGFFKIDLSRVPPEIGIWAKGANVTVQITGQVQRR